MRIDIEDVYEIQKERSRINSIPLEDMELYLDGERIEISEEKISEWKFIGLNNYYFIIDEFWDEREGL